MKRVVDLWSRPLWLGAATLFCLCLLACPDPNAVPCNKSDDCPADLYCIDSLCQEKACTINAQCGVNQICDVKKKRCKRSAQPTWRCNDDRDCRAGEECLEGTCRVIQVKTCDPACKSDEQCVRGTCEKKKVEPECKTTKECAANLECQGGKCVLKSDTPCKLDTDCTSPMRCNLLVERCQTPCSSNTDCSEDRTCRDQFCQLSCSDKLPCPSGKACKAGECIPEECNESKPCTSPKICNKGLCIEPECSAQKACKDFKVCKEGRCIEPECGPSKRCTEPKVCKDGLCITPSNKCDPNNPCPQGKKCWKGQCAPADYCERASDCNPGQSCERNQCKGGSSGGCKSDSECKTDEYCDNGTCKTKPNTGIPLGKPCKSLTSCVLGAVCTSNENNGQTYCRKVCDPIQTTTGCPSTHGCSLLGDNRRGACFPKHGGKKEGEACSSSDPKSCESGLLCIQDGSQHVCMRLCDVKNPNCANGGTCTSLKIDPVGACVPKSNGKKEGEACVARSECANNMYCLGINGKGQCTPGCDPHKQNTCSGSKSCVLIWNPQNTSKLEGAVCGPLQKGLGCGGKVCLNTQFCINGPQGSKCGQPCDPVSRPCPSGQKCYKTGVIYNGGNLNGCY